MKYDILRIDDDEKYFASPFDIDAIYDEVQRRFSNPHYFKDEQTYYREITICVNKDQWFKIVEQCCKDEFKSRISRAIIDDSLKYSIKGCGS